jgi:hypothetical protein
MEYKFINMVQTVINVFFPGGIAAFVKQGNITVIPNPGKEVVVYHPDMDDNTIAKLKAHEVPGKDTVKIMTAANFEGLNSDGLRELNLKINAEVGKIDPTANVLFTDHNNLVVISLPNQEDDSPAVNILLEYIGSLEGLVMAYVISKGKVMRYEPDRAKQIPKQVITEDDVTNFIIELENTKSVDDLLKGDK